VSGRSSQQCKKQVNAGGFVQESCENYGGTVDYDGYVRTNLMPVVMEKLQKKYAAATIKKYQGKAKSQNVEEAVDAALHLIGYGLPVPEDFGAKTEKLLGHPLEGQLALVSALAF
jgi:hypothetical protein